ncbi:MAG TPA: ABC transporter ATP-binding protein [Candidatus Caccosoma faecigallinarum]|uniref:ABC transporter ATP-binding protein n=1 Tax=Candidatus Caccosoma faecigallinarum TaxID=2840720 RepID=A0A9D1K9U5_9FIRM|nr:ABC transporter ATP-binding protein [Candidatus Caccosoma faecigallinarum]
MKTKKKSVFNILMSYSGKYKILTYLSLVLSAMSGILSLIPFVYIWFIIRDVIQVSPNFNEATNIAFYGWMAVLFALLSMLVYFGGLMCSHISAFRIAGNMRMKLMEHITKMPIGKIDELGSGKVRKIVMDSTSATETYLAHQLPDMAQALLMPLAMIIILCIFDWRLGLVSLLPCVLGFACMFKMVGPKMKEDMAQYQNAMENINNEAVEYVRGIPVVKTFNQSVYSFKRFKGAIDNYSNFCISYTKKCRGPMIAFEVAVNSVFAFLIALTLILTSSQIWSETFVLNFIFYVIFTPIISTTLLRVMYLSENTMIVEDSLNRVDSLLSIQPLKETNNPIVPLGNDIEFKNVSFKYKDESAYALKNINLKIKQNSITALVGPSGGGKSTIASLIQRFYDVDEGEIAINGVDIRNIETKTLMNKIAYVFQNGKLLKTSILENVRLARPSATKQEVLHALHLAECDDIITKLPQGIETVIGSKGTYLSGGELQRICIARAILKDADIIILDEATAFADPENEYLIQKAFTSLSKNKTVLMIAHRLSSIKNANQIFVIQNGTIIESGKHQELLKNNGVYQKMWNDYQKSIEWRL